MSVTLRQLSFGWLVGVVVTATASVGATPTPVTPRIEISATSRTVADDERVTTRSTSVWVWNPVAPDCLFPIAARYGVDRLLIWTAPGFSTDAAELARLRALRGAADARGVAVDALSGDPSWVDDPQVAARWAHEVRGSGLFDRLHLDVEPHGRPDWTTRGAALRSGLVATVDAARTAGLPVDLDIPFWYDRFTASDGERFDRALIRRADGVTVMAYRNRASAVLAAASTVLDVAAEVGTPVRIGVNVGDPGGDPPSTTYQGVSGPWIRSELAAITAGATGRPAFAGVAVHHLSALPDAGCAR